MNATPNDRRTSAQDRTADSDGHRDDARDNDARDRDAGEHAARVGAAQMAAPSTRRWRRAARFDSTS
jgi:hypothetical protein